MSKLSPHTDPDEKYEDDTTTPPPAHLLALNDRQRKFVEAFIATGNATKAAEMAGYGGKDGKYCSQRGYELMRMEKVREAITVEQLAHGHSLRSLAIKVWEDALTKEAVTLDDRKIKLAAAKEVADRFGLIKVSGSRGEVTHKHQFEGMTTEQIRDFISTKIKASQIIDDAEFTEIEAATKDIEIPSLHELKGLPAPETFAEQHPSSISPKSDPEREQSASNLIPEPETIPSGSEEGTQVSDEEAAAEDELAALMS